MKMTRWATTRWSALPKLKKLKSLYFGNNKLISDRSLAILRQD